MLQIKNTLGGGKPEGIYIWKKCEYIPEQTIVNPTFHIKANVSTQKATITSDDINFKAFGTLTDSNNFYQSREPKFCNFMNGFNNSNSSVNFAISTSTYSGQLELNYSNNSYWNAFTKMTPTDTGAELTASNLFKTTIDDTLQYTGTKTIAAMIGGFISYVVSDKETAYPDGGEKGGYWYEKVGGGLTPEMFGCTKMAVDTYTPAANIMMGDVTLYHSLGEKPRLVIIVSDNMDSYEQGTYRQTIKICFITNWTGSSKSKFNCNAVKSYDGANGDSAATNANVTLSSSYIKGNTNYAPGVNYLYGGDKYTIYTFA